MLLQMFRVISPENCTPSFEMVNFERQKLDPNLPKLVYCVFDSERGKMLMILEKTTNFILIWRKHESFLLLIYCPRMKLKLNRSSVIFYSH